MTTPTGALISTTHWLSHKTKLLPGDMRLLANISGTVDDLMPAVLREDACRSFHRLAARLADGTDVAKFKTASHPLAPLVPSAVA